MTRIRKYACSGYISQIWWRQIGKPKPAIDIHLLWEITDIARRITSIEIYRQFQNETNHLKQYLS